MIPGREEEKGLDRSRDVTAGARVGVREHRAMERKGGERLQIQTRATAWRVTLVTKEGTQGDGDEFRLGNAEFEVPVYMQVEVAS